MAEKKKKKKFRVHIVEDRCKGCGYCMAFCPVKVLEASPDYNAKGYHPPIMTNQDECTGCRMCEMLCPDFAIWVEELGEAEKKPRRAQAGRRG
jgi:2-oxoglutarate ferredoxin oxidoreductase subunit delta